MRHSGLATYKMLKMLPKFEHSPISESRAQVLARERAEQDSEFEAWRATDVLGFEKTFKPTPRSSQVYAGWRSRSSRTCSMTCSAPIFSQVEFWLNLKDEELVQNWIADSLQTRGSNRFSAGRDLVLLTRKSPMFDCA